MNKPVSDPLFWRERLVNALSQGEINKAVFGVSEDYWVRMLNNHTAILDEHIKTGDNILDAGCGFGRMYPILSNYGGYTGVDITPDFINKAQFMFPEGNFICGDLSDLPFDDNEFDWAVATSIMIMIVMNLGWLEWEKMQNELLRVSKNGILCLEYGDGDTAIESSTYYLVKG